MRISSGAGRLCVLVAVFAFFGVVGHARAGFTSVNVSPVVGYDGPYFEWSPANEAWVGVWETWDGSTGESYDISVWGTTNSDPILTITKNILNGTDFAWQGYNIDLDPFDTDTFVVPPTYTPTSGGTSGGMTLAAYSAYSLDWGVPNLVLPGQTVSFTFQVNVPDTGPFNFTLSQSPVLVPEPATILLVGLASLAMAAIGRRRRSF